MFADVFDIGGKSELHRAECRVTPGRGNPEESATERRPPRLSGRSALGISVGDSWGAGELLAALGKGERVR